MYTPAVFNTSLETVSGGWYMYLNCTATLGSNTVSPTSYICYRAKVLRSRRALLICYSYPAETRRETWRGGGGGGRHISCMTPALYAMYMYRRPNTLVTMYIWWATRKIGRASTEDYTSDACKNRELRARTDTGHIDEWSWPDWRLVS